MINKTSLPTSFLEQLINIRKSYKHKLPSLCEAKKIIDSTLGLLFPHFACSESFISNESTVAINHDTQSICNEIVSLENILTTSINAFLNDQDNIAKEVAIDFIKNLPNLKENLWLDAQAILKGDPAALNIDEVILAYPGFFAIAVYRIANYFYKNKVPTFPRLLTECAHQMTGIDIHPGATIGKHFFIDHGTGVVIGETTIIHEHVKIYQGVTLGALSVEKNLANKKRHPTIEDNVVIYSNATILGGETIIGKDSTIGGNVWITASVPANSTVYHKSELTVKQQSN
jgi:serine O-acetyltransferase